MSAAAGRFDLQGFEVGDGWRDLCHPIIAAARKDGVYIMAIYEDNGVLHVHVDRYTDAVESAIRFATHAARHTCERCGSIGTHMKINAYQYGVRCQACDAS